jgi:hypothetical protein
MIETLLRVWTRDLVYLLALLLVHRCLLVSLAFAILKRRTVALPSEWLDAEGGYRLVQS